AALLPRLAPLSPRPPHRPRLLPRRARPPLQTNVGSGVRGQSQRSEGVPVFCAAKHSGPESRLRSPPGGRTPVARDFSPWIPEGKDALTLLFRPEGGRSSLEHLALVGTKHDHSVPQLFQEFFFSLD